MKKISLLALALSGAAVLGVSAWSSARGDAQAPAASTASAVEVAPVAPVVDADGFRASRSEGVRVRERPRGTKASSTSNNSTARRGWIKVLPGEPNPRAASVISARRNVTWSKVAGGAGGGETLIISGPMHGSRAQRDLKGHVAVKCVPGESAQAHRVHVGHVSPVSRAKEEKHFGSR